MSNPTRPALFQHGKFTLASGATSDYKIECDALTPDDWEGLAAMAMAFLPSPFGRVVGVPRGGIPFAKALEKYANPASKRLLIAEDVVTTGGSIERFSLNNPVVQDDPVTVIGVCVFARGKCPGWVTPLFRLPGV